MRRRLHIEIRFTFLASLALVAATFHSARGQQSPQFTQYMSSQLWINPAYAGADDALNIALLYRSQWANVDGSPITQALTAHSLVKNEKLGMGLTIINDKIGIHSALDAHPSFSYRILFKKGTFLAFGLQAGVQYRNSDYAQLSNQVQNANDPGLSSTSVSQTAFDVGTGIYFKTPKLSLGLSVPSMMNTYYNSSEFDFSKNAYYFLGNYTFRVNSNFKLQPGLLLKYLNGLPLSFDANLTGNINEVLFLGVTYRSQSSLNGMCQVKITPQLTFGYAYDYPLPSNDILSSYSNEFLVSYLFDFYKKKISNAR
ncbi:MAG: type IX secretion system membrane protein PorP/SprF [Cyclobacteriaceae bacterium]|nr:type IX secretion system membrane protein PorP/SprF [Cyclobacteriaceae bacterium]